MCSPFTGGAGNRLLDCFDDSTVTGCNKSNSGFEKLFLDIRLVVTILMHTGTIIGTLLVKRERCVSTLRPALFKAAILAEMSPIWRGNQPQYKFYFNANQCFYEFAPQHIAARAFLNVCMQL